MWRALPLDERAAVLLRAADLLAGPWRARAQRGHHARPVQDRVAGGDRRGLRADRLLAVQRPLRPADPRRAADRATRPGVWNRIDHRPLEGFVYAITPFNFTAIAGNLPTAPALMGNTVVWKPSTTQTAGRPLPDGAARGGRAAAGRHQHAARARRRGLRGRAAPPRPRRHPLHRLDAGCSRHLWRTVGANIASYRSYPRLVGETGGKDFVVAHPSADPDVLRMALIRGAFEYQGQKCSAASRAYVSRSVWTKMGDAVPGRGRRRCRWATSTDFVQLHGRRHRRPLVRQAEGGHRPGQAQPQARPWSPAATYDDSVGYFVRPTVVVSDDPTDEMFSTEYFGPILSVHVYDDADFEKAARPDGGLRVRTR